MASLAHITHELSNQAFGRALRTADASGRTPFSFDHVFIYTHSVVATAALGALLAAQRVKQDSSSSKQPVTPRAQYSTAVRDIGPTLAAPEL